MSGGGVAFLGDPVMDLLVRVDDAFLAGNELESGGCLPVDAQQLKTLLQALESRGLHTRYSILGIDA